MRDNDEIIGYVKFFNLQKGAEKRKEGKLKAKFWTNTTI